jgi:uridylate kinase
MSMPMYRRIVLKLSGEALSGSKGFGLDNDILEKVSRDLAEVQKAGVETAIVVGGGNFWRGREGVGMDRTTADHMGMLATTMNALAMQDSLERIGVDTRVLSAIEMRQIAEPYIRRRAMRHLEKRRIVIFACGTGNPYFSTDTAAALRAAEMEASAILLAKNVDSVYDSDPHLNNKAKRIEEICYMDVINRGLAAMDTTAITLCMENNIPIIVFGLSNGNNIMKAVSGEKIGTKIHNPSSK